MFLKYNWILEIVYNSILYNVDVHLKGIFENLIPKSLTHEFGH